MRERLPANLSLLYSRFTKDVIDKMLPGDSFDVEGVEFVCKYSPESTAERFFIVKTPELAGRYVDLCREFAGAAIFELGIAEGGSTALMALAARPRKLVAIDLEDDPLQALDEFVEARNLGEVVRAYYGVDQSDRDRLAEICDAELPGEPLDLVVDDCSHVLEETRASFEALFPRLRPGGLYLIEDWNNAVLWRDAFVRGRAPASGEAAAPARPPAAPRPKQDELVRLAIELSLGAASAGEAIDSVTLDKYWVSVRRGSGELDPATFRLSDLYIDHFGFLAPG